MIQGDYREGSLHPDKVQLKIRVQGLQSEGSPRPETTSISSKNRKELKSCKKE